jgi:hypothetical protein
MSDAPTAGAQSPGHPRAHRAAAAPARSARGAAASYDAGYATFDVEDEAPADGRGWFGHAAHGVRTWWRYHPAHMAVDLAAPLLQTTRAQAAAAAGHLAGRGRRAHLRAAVALISLTTCWWRC